jgi:DNA (cytosine-5)-methyltransferase 1
MSRKKLLVADLLCGAGGSSTGCERALRDLGLEMELVCVNHWDTAIATHTMNHPKARHFVQDIATVRPHLLVPEGYLDLLMASPTCTHHSVARGGKPTSDQQRSDPWHIITWLTELRVKRIIIENVWEFTGWGPVDPKTGKPIPARKGEYFNAWIETLRRLGFDPEWKKLNAADYGDATTRQRFILMARSDRRRVAWPMPTHTKRSDGDGLSLMPHIKPWRSAREIIDWELKGKSIFGRKKDLAPKTMERIYAGAVKFKWPEPYLVILRQHMAGMSVDGPLPVIAANGTHIGLAQPVIGNLRKGTAPVSVDAPLPTQSIHASMFAAEPIILSQHNSGAARSAGDPLPTITTGGAGAEDHPGCARPMLVEPFILSRFGEGYGETRAHSVEEPMPTSSARGAGYLIEPEPFVLSQASGGAPRGVEDPIPTQTGGGSGGAHALISPYYGNGSGETCCSDAEPLPTVTSKGRFGVVVPVTHSTGGHQAIDVEQPLPTLTTAKGGEFAVVMPVTHDDASDRVRDVIEPLPTITGANRGELAFITAQHGERPGQAPRVHSVDSPTPTIAATGHVDLVVTTDGYDILFRMLEPHELAAAMGFTSDDQSYEFAGTKTDQIKQIGNAVSVAKMKACVGALMADAVPRPRAVQKPARAAA